MSPTARSTRRYPRAPTPRQRKLRDQGKDPRAPQVKKAARRPKSGKKKAAKKKARKKSS
jgi:hypothetical protein